MTVAAPVAESPGDPIDPLLTAARILLIVLLAGVALTALAVVFGVAAHIGVSGIPATRGLADPAWRPISGALFAMGALWLVADTVLALLAMIAAVARDAAFERANVTRLERIAHNTIGLAILGVIADLAGTPIGGSINGFDIGVDLPASIGFALLIFILARVFRKGAAMRDDLAGVV